MSIREGVWKSLVWTARVLLYPVHFALRILARLVLIVVAIAPLVGLVLLGYLFWQDILKGAHSLAASAMLPSAVRFLIAVGLFVVILKAMGQLFLMAIRLLGEAMMDALPGDWDPGWEVWSSLEETWGDYVAEIPGTFLRTLGSACLVALVALVVGVLAWVAYPLTKPRVVEPIVQQGIVDRYVVLVVDANDGRAKETVKEHFPTGPLFSLTYLKDAQPQVGDGICLEEGHKAWLRVFREAIVDCVKLERSRSSKGPKQGSTPPYVPTFDVKGFASVAPMQWSDGDGELPNCEVANRRADAVASFLADEEKYRANWACEEVGDDFKLARRLCTGDEKVYERSLDGIDYRVRVLGWSDPKEMEDKKPADDGALPNDRRYRVELLNRAVHIAVPEDFCRVSDSTRRGGGGPAISSELTDEPSTGGTLAGTATGET